MSDIESYRSASPSREILERAANTDDVLNDHRHQPASLPIRVTGNNTSTSSAISDGEDEDGDEVINVQKTELEQQRRASKPIKAKLASNADNDAAPRHFQSTRNTNWSYINSIRKDFYLKTDDDDDTLGSHHSQQVPYNRRSSSFLAPGIRRKNSRSRSQSVSEQARVVISPDVEDADNKKSASGSGGILMNNASSSVRKTKSGRSNSNTENNLESDALSPMMKIRTNDTSTSDAQMHNKRERRASRSSIDSEADSHASRSSQETEEDVCFPMLREHIRIKGIDFDEIEEFIKEEREESLLMKEQQQIIAERTAMRVTTRDARSIASLSNASNRTSSAALKYTPKNLLKRTNTALKKLRSRSNSRTDIYGNDSIASIHVPERSHSDSSTISDEYDEKINESPTRKDLDDLSSENVKFGGTRINDNESVLPDRFSFFSSESEETIHAPDIPSLVEPGQSVRELFRNGEGTWWLDCVCPTDAEMKMLAKAFGIHPLTAEDIRMQETREKVELFRSYYFVCFHTFEPDKESEDYLEPINVYIVVLRDGMLTFHFSPISHPANVRRRVRQLRDYVDVSADWLCYALIDDITDGFAPVITGIEYEADAIEDSVFVSRELDFSHMLQRIGESRRKVMTLMRLLSGKADVIKMFAKRCQDEAAINQSSTLRSHTNLAGLGGISGSGQGTPLSGGNGNNNSYPLGSYQGGTSFGPGPGAPAYMFNPSSVNIQTQMGRAQPRADIALYLGDIQDHVVTMFQNLLAYEKIFSRSHSNYLAQLQVESFNSNNKVTEMLSKVTLIGTLLVPLNLVTGLFGMNVHVPGEGGEGLSWFFGILGIMVCIAICFFILAKIWLKEVNASGNSTVGSVSSKRSIKSLGLKTRTKEAAKSIISFPNKYD